MHKCLSILVLVGFVFLFPSCKNATSSSSSSSSNLSESLSFTDSSSVQFQDVTAGNSGGTTVNLSVNLGTTAKNVTFIYTNTSIENSSSLPTLTSATLSTAKSMTLKNVTFDKSSLLKASTLNKAQRSSPYIQNKNRALAKQQIAGELKNTSSRSLLRDSTSTATTYAVGNTLSINYVDDNDDWATQSVTLRAVNSNSTANRKVCVWVADNCYSGYASTNSSAADVEPYEITDSMAQSIADKYLSSSGSDNIYTWVTSIFGKEYYDSGSSVSSGLISPDGTIHIFLVDLNPNRTSSSSSVTLGYFYDVNNYNKSSSKASDLYYSDEKIMFMVDAVSFANTSENIAAVKGTSPSSTSTWSGSDYWPAEIYSTLAHEFQHMIEFYQKTILNNADNETWVNEMCSMLTEDCVADKLLVPGPRGVALNSDDSFNYGTGSALTSSGTIDNYGRLNLFNSSYFDTSLTTWGYDVESYSAAYSFGAWLARNYGGPALLKEIATNSYSGTAAVTQAISTVDSLSVSFSTLLWQWATAIYLSTGGRTDYYNLIHYNDSTKSAEDAFSYSYNSLSYELGSINAWKYANTVSSSKVSGPFVYNEYVNNAGYLTWKQTSIPSSAVLYYRAGTSLTGTQTCKVTLPANVSLTVVVEPVN